MVAIVPEDLIHGICGQETGVVRDGIRSVEVKDLKALLSSDGEEFSRRRHLQIVGNGDEGCRHVGIGAPGAEDARWTHSVGGKLRRECGAIGRISRLHEHGEVVCGIGGEKVWNETSETVRWSGIVSQGAARDKESVGLAFESVDAVVHAIGVDGRVGVDVISDEICGVVVAGEDARNVDAQVMELTAVFIESEGGYSGVGAVGVELLYVERATRVIEEDLVGCNTVAISSVRGVVGRASISKGAIGFDVEDVDVGLGVIDCGEMTSIDGHGVYVFTEGRAGDGRELSIG